jgi:signal transduction histidine kinase/ActR/RegA family two-component response regulator
MLSAGAAGFVLSELWTGMAIDREAQTLAAAAEPELRSPAFQQLFEGGPAQKRWRKEAPRLALRLPPAERTTVLDAAGTIVWSDDPRRVGHRAAGVPLGEALAGRVSSATVERAASGTVAIEVYVPVVSRATGRVVGIVALARPMDPLLARIERERRHIWTVALGGGAFLSLVLVVTAVLVFGRAAGRNALAALLAERTQALERTTRQLQEALQKSERRATEIDRVLEVTEAIGSAASEEELFAVVAEGAARACGVDRCSIFLRDAAGQLLVPVATRSAGGEPAGDAESLPELPLAEAPPGVLEAVRRQEPVVVPEPGGESRVPPWLERFGAKSALVVPLVHRGKTAGVLLLDHRRDPRGFAPEQVHLATTLAAQAAMALDKARLYQEIAERLQQTETLLAVSRAISSTLDLTEALRQTLREVARALGADTAGAWCLNRTGDQLLPTAGYHVPKDTLEAFSKAALPVSDDLVTLLKRIRGPVYATNSQADARLTHALARLLPHKSLMVQPVQANGEILGILALAWTRKPHSFKPGELNLLAGVGRQCAVAVELSRTQSRISQQERLNALGQMASGIAHDFNNALVPVAGYAELLLENPGELTNAERAAKYLELILTGVRDAASVVGRLREFYRRREGAETFTAVALNQLVEQAVALTRPKWRDEALRRGRSIEVRTTLAPGPPIRGNESELREMLTNLIFNAVDAMPEGGTITLRTSVRPAAADGADPGAAPEVMLEVSDTGVGMTEEVRRRCLEPFFSTKGERGSGLGLAMVYGTVRRHRGTVDIDSAVGIGTTVIIRLPADSTPVPAATRTMSRGLALSVLVADDEPMARDVMTQFLSLDGHRVEAAADGREALEKFRAGRFDVVVTDQAMPILSGDQLARSVKALAPSVPVILVTGFGDIMTASGQVPAGVDSILTKPVSLATLREALATVRARPGGAAAVAQAGSPRDLSPPQPDAARPAGAGAPAAPRGSPASRS